MWNWLRQFFKHPPTTENALQVMELKLGEEVIAKIAVDGFDFPWTYGHLLDSGTFDRFRTYLSDVDTWPDEDPELDRVCVEVTAKGGFRLRSLTTSERFTDIVLHHQGNVVWFRYVPEAGD